jgi:aminoglycoside phosphotransferase (APT) family kinase protein
MAMHPDEMPIGEDTVRRLIGAQFPQWAQKPVRRVEAAGTVNTVFRVGNDLAARFPLRASDPEAMRGELVREAGAMRQLAAVCPFPTPAPLAVGDPGEGYPLPWSIQTWLPGETASTHLLEESEAFARDLATLISALREADSGGKRFEGGGRGGNLSDSDEWMKVCLRESEGLLPVDQLAELWARFRVLPSAGPDVMSHCDLIPGNLLVDGERLVGVLDGGTFAPADPALDLVAAWHMLAARGRETLRTELAVSDLEWERGMAWAFQQSMGLVWYYQDSNPAMSALGRSTLERILETA